jgi:hypothetical protein
MTQEVECRDRCVWRHDKLSECVWARLEGWLLGSRGYIFRHRMLIDANVKHMVCECHSRPLWCEGWRHVDLEVAIPLPIVSDTTSLKPHGHANTHVLPHSPSKLSPVSNL